jgi:mono/diheme cytochrome c family protein
MARIGAIAALAVATATIPARAETPAERGAYLVRGIAACGSCHANPVPDAPELAGGRRFSELAYTAHAANLTPDVETGVGGWTDEQLAVGIREGKRPRGSVIGPPMPISTYRNMSLDDARAIVAYLRTLKPVANKVPRSTYRVPPPASYGPPADAAPDATSADPVARGRYLATAVGQCMDCHSRRGEDGLPDFAHGLGKGGAELRGPWGVIVVPALRPSDIGHYADADLRRIIAKGERPDGSKLAPPMPVAWYANMTDDDVSAIVAFLRSLPAR